MIKETFKRAIICTSDIHAISIPKLFIDQGKFKQGDVVTITIEKECEEEQ